jgi:hypothetical protein
MAAPLVSTPIVGRPGLSMWIPSKTVWSRPEDDVSGDSVACA